MLDGVSLCGSPSVMPDPDFSARAEQIVEKLCTCVIGAHLRGRGRMMLPIILDALRTTYREGVEAGKQEKELI